MITHEDDPMWTVEPQEVSSPYILQREVIPSTPKPKPEVIECRACATTGVSSSGHTCYPCTGRGWLIIWQS